MEGELVHPIHFQQVFLFVGWLVGLVFATSSALSLPLGLSAGA